jgi:hypothetical protein
MVPPKNVVERNLPMLYLHMSSPSPQRKNSQQQQEQEQWPEELAAISSVYMGLQALKAVAVGVELRRCPTPEHIHKGPVFQHLASWILVLHDEVTGHYELPKLRWNARDEA